MANATCVAVSHEGPVTVLSMQFEPHNLLGPDLMAGMREGLRVRPRMAREQFYLRVAFGIFRLERIPHFLQLRSGMQANYQYHLLIS